MAKVDEAQAVPTQSESYLVWQKCAVEHAARMRGFLSRPLAQPKFAAPEGDTLAGAARTDDPLVVPMSGGAEPAGAAKHPA